MSFRQSNRLLALPSYIFSEISAIKAEAEKRGVKLLSLGIGDPDLPTPQSIVAKIQEAVAKPQNHAYSPYEGTSHFRQACARWMERRFGVMVHPDTELIALIGSKEGIAHFPLAFCNPGDVCLYPSPGYPIFQTAILLAGGVPVPVPLAPEKGFLPDVQALEQLFEQKKPKYLLLNFPSNPTSVVAPRATLQAIVDLARRYGVILGYDNAYSEVYFGENNRPPSLLEIPGAKEVAIEFHSLSKTFNMTGWRLGFAVGNASLVAGLLRVKTNIDSGPLLAVQEAGAYAIDNAEAIVPSIREVYQKRRERMLLGLKRLGIECVDSGATFFLWARVPQGRASMAFTKELIETQGLVVTPGAGFGAEGEGFFRMSLTVSMEAIDDALRRLENYLKRK